MPTDAQSVRRLAVGGPRDDRLTRDAPVTADVWLAFSEPDTTRIDLLLTPEDGIAASDLAVEIRERLSTEGARSADIGVNARQVAARLTMEELIELVLPLSRWGQKVAAQPDSAEPADVQDLAWLLLRERRPQERRPQERADALTQPHTQISWLSLLSSAIVARRDRTQPEVLDVDDLATAAWERSAGMADAFREAPSKAPPMLWKVTRNRPATTAGLSSSRRTVKADAAARLFDIDFTDMAWAVIDTGIDAEHIAFRKRTDAGPRYKQAFANGGHTAVIATYDFTRLRVAQTHSLNGTVPADPLLAKLVQDHHAELDALGSHLLGRKPIDWSLLAPFLRVPHTTKGYVPPVADHGTHIAGILAGDWPDAEQAHADGPLMGLCPGLGLYDLRVFDATGDADEFTISAALQFVDHLNGYGRTITIAGANLSLSLPFEVDVYACGQTPVCVEANRLVDSGVVVVAAAGNQGRDAETTSQGYRTISLTDPGNADQVITVGSTHAENPYAYGVSYFSSRGPTGDGRAKPDLIAPGEKIAAPSIGDRAWDVKDGTSQAAAHVSGAAALLLAYQRELVGRPRRVKELLTKNASDLGRERTFQGAGLIDVLRTLQAT